MGRAWLAGEEVGAFDVGVGYAEGVRTEVVVGVRGVVIAEELVEEAIVNYTSRRGKASTTQLNSRKFRNSLAHSTRYTPPQCKSSLFPRRSANLHCQRPRCLSVGGSDESRVVVGYPTLYSHDGKSTSVSTSYYFTKAVQNLLFLIC